MPQSVTCNGDDGKGRGSGCIAPVCPDLSTSTARDRVRPAGCAQPPQGRSGAVRDDPGILLASAMRTRSRADAGDPADDRPVQIRDAEARRPRDDHRDPQRRRGAHHRDLERGCGRHRRPRGLARPSAPRADSRCIVAVDDTGVVGYASFGDWRPHGGFRHTVEHSVYVRGDQRGRGIGKTLMVELIDRARVPGHARHGRGGRERQRRLDRACTSGSASARSGGCRRSARSSAAGST